MQRQFNNMQQFPMMPQQQQFSRPSQNFNPESKHLMGKRISRWTVGDQRLESQDSDGDDVQFSEQNCEMVAIALDETYHGLAALLKHGKAMASFGVSGVNRNRAKVRAATLGHLINYDVTEDHFSAVCKAVARVNNSFLESLP